MPIMQLIAMEFLSDSFQMLFLQTLVDNERLACYATVPKPVGDNSNHRLRSIRLNHMQWDRPHDATDSHDCSTSHRLSIDNAHTSPHSPCSRDRDSASPSLVHVVMLS
jgi:hypothetical protein